MKESNQTFIVSDLLAQCICCDLQHAFYPPEQDDVVAVQLSKTAHNDNEKYSTEAIKVLIHNHCRLKAGHTTYSSHDSSHSDTTSKDITKPYGNMSCGHPDSYVQMPTALRLVCSRPSHRRSICCNQCIIFLVFFTSNELDA